MTATMHAEIESIDQGSTHARLVEAAAEVFSEQGYDRTRVQEIARRAGMTTGAIYANFSGKAELLSRAIDLASTPELDRIFSEGVLGGTAAEILVHMGEQVTDGDEHASGTGSQLLFEAFAAARRNPDVAAALRQGLESKFERFASLIAVGKAEGSIDPDVDADAAAHLAMSIAMGFLMFEMVHTSTPDSLGWSDLIRRIVGSISSGRGTSERGDAGNGASRSITESK